MQVPEFKLTLLGPPNTGKTLFVERLLKNTNNVINSGYKPTLGVEVNSIDLNGDLGKLRLNIWDNAGDDNYRGLKEKYHQDTKAAIIFKKSGDESYLEYKNELPIGTMCEYIIDYSLDNPEKSVEQYKQMLYDFVINISL